METNTAPAQSRAQPVAAHTPLPWAVSSSTMLVAPNDPRDMPVIGNLIDLMGVSSIGINEARANAAFIVRACNAHAALVEALERMERTFAGIAHADTQAGEWAIRDARAALQHAKE